LKSPQRTAEVQRRSRFEKIYRDNRGSVLAYLLRRTSNPDDAADVLADTFLTAWRRLDDVPSGGEARLWLYGVARRSLANHRRGERRRSVLAGRIHAELAVAYRAPDLDGHLADLADALGNLAAADQELLALVAWERLDHQQIASVLGCSRNAVDVRLHRARRRLSEALAVHRVQRGRVPEALARGDLA
jgi:RNA polymerase sigma-70 factor (ECF subfamily)